MVRTFCVLTSSILLDASQPPTWDASGPPVDALSSGFDDDDSMSAWTHERAAQHDAWHGSNVGGESTRALRVYIEPEYNWFLARLLRLFAPSFADPVVDPSTTQEVVLHPRVGLTDDYTSGEGEFKYAMAYALKGSYDDVVVKWFRRVHEDDKLANVVDYETYRRSFKEHIASVMTDFYSQSIAHLLSHLYSERVGERQKVFYMQPLLVTAQADDHRGIHFGLMERRLESFYRHPPSLSIENQFSDFVAFLNNDIEFMTPLQPQGWHQRESHLYMTDCAWVIVDEFTDSVTSENIGPDTKYNLRKMYDILVAKVEAMAEDPMDLSVENTGCERCLFGKSLADDKKTIQEIVKAKFELGIQEKLEKTVLERWPGARYRSASPADTWSRSNHEDESMSAWSPQHDAWHGSDIGSDSVDSALDMVSDTSNPSTNAGRSSLSSAQSSGDRAARVDGESARALRVRIEAKYNGFLARLLRLFPPSSADPVVDPSTTQEVVLHPRVALTDDHTSGEGEFKYALAYALEGTNVDVVVKWFRWVHEHDERAYSLNFETYRRPFEEHIASVMTDFYSQSIAHLLSHLYSERVGERQKVFYMQPLLVTAPADDRRGLHYGLMERKLESFHSYPPSPAIENQFGEFVTFLNNGIEFMTPRDTQGWHQRESHLYMTDCAWNIVDEFTDRMTSEFIGPDTDYNLPKMYDILVAKVEAMTEEPMDLSVENTGCERCLFGKSLADDQATVQQIVKAKFVIDCIPVR